MNTHRNVVDTTASRSIGTLYSTVLVNLAPCCTESELVGLAELSVCFYQWVAWLNIARSD
jgi:hypothetical protein